jgi:hypothetical protein
LIHLDRGDSQTAVNDLVNAVNLDMLNFDYSVALAKALWAENRFDMTVRQFNSAENIALTDGQRAVIYYYRAQVYEDSLKMSLARQDWGSLLSTVDQVPVEWRTHALERWFSTSHSYVTKPTPLQPRPAHLRSLPPDRYPDPNGNTNTDKNAPNPHGRQSISCIRNDIYSVFVRVLLERSLSSLVTYLRSRYNAPRKIGEGL